MKHNHFFVPALGGKLSMTDLYAVICEQKFLILIGLVTVDHLLFPLINHGQKQYAVTWLTNHPTKRKTVCAVFQYFLTHYLWEFFVKGKQPSPSVFHKNQTHTQVFTWFWLIIALDINGAQRTLQGDRVNWNEKLNPWKDILRNSGKTSPTNILSFYLGEINLTRYYLPNKQIHFTCFYPRKTFLFSSLFRFKL